jgi:NADPH2:quinone reductase
MQAFQITDYSESPGLKEIEIPTPRAGQVQIRIAACGLNFADLLMAQGKYQERPDPPVTMGLEMAGTVTALGEGVTLPAVGTRVAVFAGAGGLAEYGVFPAELCLPLPEDMPFDHAAAFQVAYGTSHLALSRRAQLQAGETLVVTGAAGGVGLTAVEIGKLMGATVIAIARGTAKLAIAKAAGAAHLIDSDSDDIRAQIKALGGADVVYDAVGGDLFTACFRATNPEARVIVIGFASGTIPQIAANHLLVKNITLIGHYWGGYMKFGPKVLTASLATLLGWYADGRLHPHVSHALPLANAPEALELLRSRTSTGKVVVTI